MLEQATEPSLCPLIRRIAFARTKKGFSYTVGWNVSDQKVTISLNQTQLILHIGDASVNVTGVSGHLNDIPCISATNRSMLSLRFVSENLGYDVIWNGEEKTIQ